MIKNILIGLSLTSFSLISIAQQTVCLGDPSTICAGDQITIEVCGPAGGNDPNVIFLNNVTEVNLNDDQFSPAVPIGFNFTFYGQNYNQCVIASNGYLTFGPGNANAYSPWSINQAAPSAGIPTNAVMGPWQDYNPGAGGFVGYTTIGTAPNRQFVTLWKNVIMFGTQQLGCSAIVLHEGSNKVEVFIDEKPVVNWNGGAAIEATQNDNGTIAHVVPGRNFPTQWTANLDGQEWIPNGPNDYIQNPTQYKAYIVASNSLTWLDTEGNTYTSNNNQITVTPTPVAPTDSIGYFINYSSCAVGQQLLTSDTTWVTVNTVNVAANGTADFCTQGNGEATALATGGSQPYTYQWDDPNNQTTQTATGLFTGIYNITATDAIGCQASTNVFVGDSPISLSTTYTQVSCPGGSDGTATVSVTPVPATATYNWYNAGGQSTATATGLSAGTYNVEVVTGVGCIDTAEVIVDEVPAMLISLVNSVDATCNSGNDGIATVEVTQGTPPYSYAWTNSNSTLQTASDLPAGTHTVTVTDANGCVITLDVTIGEPSPLQIDVIAPDTTVCVGDSAYLYALGSGGSSVYTYTWTLNGNVVGVGDTIGVLPNADNNQYCVTLTEQCGSPSTQACMNVRYPDDIDPLISPDITGACFPVEVNFDNVTNTAEVIDFTVWDFGDGTIDTINALEGISHEFGEGLFDVGVEIVTESGCSYFAMFNDLIEGYSYPEAAFYVNPNPASVFEPNVDAFSQSGADIIDYQWIAPGAQPGTSSLKNPSFEYPSEVENYTVTLIVENSNGCMDTTERIVRIQNEVILYAPNTFTPDGDEHNQIWRVYIQGVDIYNFDLEIYNRWGELIWESHDPGAGWDGTYGNELVKDGTYIWKIRAFDQENDNKYEFNGFVNVLR